ncbi:N-methylnicotinate transmembrane transporter [Aureococcus anophagefferens]|nr:N-methylnicotinate transmembrane transporter [Aureococcus anophagefferens]
MAACGSATGTGDKTPWDVRKKPVTLAWSPPGEKITSARIFVTTSTTVAKVLKSFASRYDLGLPVASLCLRNRARVLHPDLPVLAQIEGDLAQLCEVAELADGPPLVGPDKIVAATRQVHETKTNHGVVAADLELDGETYDEVREELVARGLHVAAALLPIFAEGAPEPAVVDRVARAADLRGEARAVAAERLAPAHALAARRVRRGRFGAARTDPCNAGSHAVVLPLAGEAGATPEATAALGRVFGLLAGCGAELEAAGGLRLAVPDEVQCARYPPGAPGYRAHRDWYPTEHGNDREVTLLLYLNEHWTDDDGGALSRDANTAPALANTTQHATMHREPYEEVQEAPEDAEETSPVDAALEEAGFNAVSVEVLLITGLGWFADGLETSALSVLLPALATEFSATAGELAAFASAVAAGQAVGAFGWGAVADARAAAAPSSRRSPWPRPWTRPRAPRRRSDGSSRSRRSRASAAAATCPSPSRSRRSSSRRAAARPVGSARVPLARPRSLATRRPAGVVLMHVFYELGELSAIGLAALLLPGRWRLFVSLLGAPTAVAAVLGALRLPESPRWLWARGDRGKAAAALDRVARRPGPTPDDKPRVVASNGAAAAVGSGWVTWAPEIAATRDLRSGPTYAVLAAARVLACTVFLLASALVERHGPWPTLLGFLACTMAASGGLAALLARRSTTTELRFGAAYCALTFFFNGVWPVLYVVTPAAFPTDARGAGFGAANVGKQLGAVALPLVAGALLHRSLLALGLVLTGGWLLGAAAAAVQARRPAYLARGGEEDRADGVDADSPLV